MHAAYGYCCLTLMAVLAMAVTTLPHKRLRQFWGSFCRPALPRGVSSFQSTPSGNSLPKVVHKTIPAGQLKPGRLIVVGDVHGCAAELRQLLDKLAFAPQQDNLVFTGDLVNKGPASLEVLDMVIALRALSVRGNHDDGSLHRWSEWQQEKKKLKDHHAWLAQARPHHIEALSTLPFTISIPSYGVTVVHAGLAPGVPLLDQDLWAMYKMRNLADASQAEAAVAAQDGNVRAVGSRWLAVEKDKFGGQAWAGLWSGPHHVFFGHDAKRCLQLCPYATGLDTACVYGRQLTAAVLPPLSEVQRGPLSDRLAQGLPVSREDLGVQLVSVDAAKAYQEPGRPAAPTPAAEAEA